VQVWTLNLKEPGTSLAFWLANNVPDLFLWEWRRVRRRMIAANAKQLGQDVDDDDDDGSGDFDIGDDTVDLAAAPAGVLTPDASPQSTLGIQPVEVTPLDPSGALEELDSSQVPVDGDAVTAAGAQSGSSGQTIASAASSSGLSTANVIGAVGQALTSNQEIAALSNAALTYFATQGSPAMADVLATQLATVASGAPAQALTTAATAAGDVPAQVSTGADGAQSVTPLTAAQLAALTPSGLTVFWAQYGVYVGVGVAFAVVLALARHHKRWR
jgi:hypothetical protein